METINENKKYMFDIWVAFFDGYNWVQCKHLYTSRENTNYKKMIQQAKKKAKTLNEKTDVLIISWCGCEVAEEISIKKQ